MPRSDSRAVPGTSCKYLSSTQSNEYCKTDPLATAELTKDTESHDQELELFREVSDYDSYITLDIRIKIEG